MTNKKQRIVDEVLVRLSDDIKVHNDLTVLEELLSKLPTKILLGSLPEEGKEIDWDQPSPFGEYK